MKTHLIYIVLLITLIGCTNKEEMNFRTVVDEKDNVEPYHLLSIFESENYELLNENDSLFSLYLNNLEVEIAKQNFDSTETSRNKFKQQYHLIEKRKIENHTILLIGKSIIGKGRNYSIMFRILDYNGKIINTITVAAWNESVKNFYGCEISNNWSEIKHITNGKVIREFVIDSHWKIKTTGNNVYN